jgi:hypothetical protein
MVSRVQVRVSEPRYSRLYFVFALFTSIEVLTSR